MISKQLSVCTAAAIPPVLQQQGCTQQQQACMHAHAGNLRHLQAAPQPHGPQIMADVCLRRVHALSPLKNQAAASICNASSLSTAPGSIDFKTLAVAVVKFDVSVMVTYTIYKLINYINSSQLPSMQPGIAGLTCTLLATAWQQLAAPSKLLFPQLLCCQ